MSINRGRDSAVLVLTTLFAYLLINSNPVSATTYTVGDGGGWTFNVVTWPIGKKFKVGDVLAFNYNPMNHNVVAVDNFGFGTCTHSTSAKVYTSGKDLIPLVLGPNYFICSFPGHCKSKVKIALVAN